MIYNRQMSLLSPFQFPRSPGINLAPAGNFPLIKLRPRDTTSSLKIIIKLLRSTLEPISMLPITVVITFPPHRLIVSVVTVAVNRSVLDNKLDNLI